MDDETLSLAIWLGGISFHLPLDRLTADEAREMCENLRSTFHQILNEVPGLIAQMLDHRQDPANHAIHKELRAAIWERDGKHCRYCGEEVTIKTVRIDHVQPFLRGGLTRSDNLVAACHHCNSRKRSRTPEEAGMPLLPLTLR